MKKETYYCDVCGKEVSENYGNLIVNNLKSVTLKDGWENELPLVEMCQECFDKFQENFVDLAVTIGLKEYIEIGFRKKYLKSEVKCLQQEH